MNTAAEINTGTNRERWAGWAFWLALLAAGLIMYGRYLFGNLPVGADNALMYCPFYSLRWQGGPPLWNPYSLSGTGLYDNLQAALLYPLRWPFFFIADWRAYFGLFNFLHYVIALAGAALFLRALGLRRAAALAGAILYGAGGHLAGRIINPTIFYGCCWLPWLLLGAAGRGLRFGWITTISLAMILWIGSPHLMFYGMIGWTLVWLSLVLVPAFRIPHLKIPHSAFRIPHSENPQSSIHHSSFIIHHFLPPAWHIFLALVLAAPTLIPGVLRARDSIRTESTVEKNLADSVEYSEIGRMLLGGTFDSPIYPEYIDKCCYVGPFALALILWLALRRDSWRDRRFYCGLLLVAAGLFFALGKNIGVQFIMPHVPGFRDLAGAPRALALTVAGLALLAALALDALTRRPARFFGGMLIGLGILALFLFYTKALALTQPGDGFLAGKIARSWAEAPDFLSWPLFPLIDGAAGLLAGGLVLCLAPSRDRLRMAAACALIFVQLWHFSPRVLPPTERPEFFDPPAPVRYLMNINRGTGVSPVISERGTGVSPVIPEHKQPAHATTPEPFRIAGYDALRMHDCEFDNQHKIAFLTPNLATLYGLEDIQGFDPLIRLNYLNLFLKTSGRAVFNDPIHNLDIEHPDEDLFDLLGVRYLIGSPYDRRLTTIPVSVNPQEPVAEIKEWNAERAAGGPITGWSFVSALTNALRVPLGTEVAQLHIEADEGAFDFPVRNGIETADVHAYNPIFLSLPAIASSENFRAVVNWRFRTRILAPELGYRLENNNYRGLIAFGRPLHVKRAEWRLAAPNIGFSVASQAYRLAPAADDPWVLRDGSAESVTPVYEYRNARPRAVLAASYAKMDTGVLVGANQLNQTSTTTGSIQWLERGNNVLKLRVKTDRPALLVLREIWDAGWRAEVANSPRPVLKVNGILRGIELPAGQSEVRLIYRPRLPLTLLALAAAIMGGFFIYIVAFFGHRRMHS